MASIEKRNRNGRSRWYVRYRDPAGRQRTKVFDRKIDAERYLTTGGQAVGQLCRSAARRRNRGRIRQEMEGRTGSSEAEHS